VLINPLPFIIAEGRMGFMFMEVEKLGKIMQEYGLLEQAPKPGHILSAWAYYLHGLIQ
jgi:hypothetical protein